MSRSLVGLLSQSRRGDPEAVARLLKRANPLVRHYSLMVDGLDTEDLQQDLIICVIKAVKVFEREVPQSFGPQTESRWRAG